MKCLTDDNICVKLKKDVVLINNVAVAKLNCKHGLQLQKFILTYFKNKRDIKEISKALEDISKDVIYFKKNLVKAYHKLKYLKFDIKIIMSGQ